MFLFYPLNKNLEAALGIVHALVFVSMQHSVYIAIASNLVSFIFVCMNKERGMVW